MGLLARAGADRLAALFPDCPPHSVLRAPEIGSVMVRGRTGGTGAPFNLGEMTVTRCAVRLETGEVGHAYVQGRDKGHALRAAVVDALLQTAAAPALRRDVIGPLAAEEQAAQAVRARKAAATKVEFFTLVRGEDK
jgi:alpha-D-ribose 1-methylphosphonate 5-triphosphate synthase subunit PhnG